MKLAKDGSYVVLELGDKDLSLTQDQILKNQEKAKCFDELHEAGYVRIKYESLKKLQEDAKCYNNLQLPDDDTMRDYWNRKEIVEQLKKIDLHKIIRFTGTQSNDRHEQHNQEIAKLQKIVEKKK